MTGRLREWWSRAAGLLRGPRHDEFEEEFELHLDLAAQDFEERGLRRDEARRLARARFGSSLSAREHAQDQYGLPRFETAMIDLRHAARALYRSPAFSVTALLILSVGFGANLAVLTIANAALFKGFRGVSNHDRVVYLTTRRDCCVSHQDVLDWRAAGTSFDAIGAVADLRVSVDGGAGVETVTATEVTAEVFAVLGVHPFLGRAFAAGDDDEGAHPVALLSHEYWQSRFAGDPAALGQAMRVNGVATTIVGVMAPQFAFPQRQDLWLPLGQRGVNPDRNARGFWFAVARLADNISLQQARAELEAVGATLARAHPSTNRNIRPNVQTFREFFIGPNAVAIYAALSGAVGLLLLVAGVNLATLLLARGTARQRELVVRLALGAGRYRIVQQQIFESTLLSVGAAAIGWFVAEAIVDAYQRVSVPPTQPWARQLLDLSVDWRMLVYAACASGALGLFIGLWSGLRLLSLDPHLTMRDGGLGTVGTGGRNRVLRVMVTTQVAIAVVLLAAAGVLIRSFFAVGNLDRGFDASKVVVALTTLPAARYPDVASQMAYYERLMAGARSIPGIDAVALVDGLPGQSSPSVGFDVQGRSMGADDERPSARVATVTSGFFASVGTAVERGRDFDQHDGAAQRAVAIVNRRFAERYFAPEDAIGRHLRLWNRGAPGEWLTIVGIAPDLHYGDGTRADIDPIIYLSFQQRLARGAWLVAHTSTAGESLKASVRRHIQSVDPDLPLWLGPYTLEQWIAGANWRRGVSSGLFAIFAVLALLLACLGVYAILAGMVAQRRQEIGLRVAVGATRKDVVALVFRHGLQPTVMGLAIGLLTSIATNRLLSAQLVQVAPSDPVTLAMVVVVLLLAAVTGCIVPALRATRIDPLIALRLH